MERGPVAVFCPLLFWCIPGPIGVAFAEYLA